MDRTAFLKVVTRELFPVARAEGFKGAGSTLRRIAGSIVHVLNIQGSTSTTGCYINLGASLTFLAMHGLTNATVESVKESQCVFRTRLDPPVQARQQWDYGATEAQTTAMVAAMRVAWSTVGRAWFSRYQTYPDDYEALIADPSALTCHPAHALVLARIAKHLGNASRAIEIVQNALPRTPPLAIGLKQNLQRLIDDAI